VPAKSVAASKGEMISKCAENYLSPGLKNYATFEDGKRKGFPRMGGSTGGNGAGNIYQQFELATQ